MAPIQMLWIGPRLSALERLSIASFLANGHEVRLYTYGDVEGIPEGVAHHDGREVLPAAHVFTNPAGIAKGSYAAFSNLFRYKLLLDHGGLWADMDVVCLHPFDFETEYVVARERLSPNTATAAKAEKLNPCVLKAPANARVMLECYAAAMDSNKGELEAGDIGPDLVTKRFARHGLDRFALPAAAICSVDWWNLHRLATSPLVEEPGMYALHFWNEVWRFQRMDKDAAYAPDGAYETLKRRYGVV
jgi:hypothetical protein